MLGKTTIWVEMAPCLAQLPEENVESPGRNPALGPGRGQRLEQLRSRAILFHGVRVQTKTAKRARQLRVILQSAR